MKGRCKATNLCLYCAKRYALETAVMWGLDAAEDAPQHWVVLTAREHLTRAEASTSLEQLRKSARKIWPDVRWAVSVEFQRRGALHLNLLVKGVPVDQGEEFGNHLAHHWCARHDAEPWAQFTQGVWDGEGLTRYLTEHVVKASQRPAVGWRGHRTSQTRDYLVRPASVLRMEAQAYLRERWAIHRAIQRGVPAELVEAEVSLELGAGADRIWELVQVRTRSRSVIEPPIAGEVV